MPSKLARSLPLTRRGKPVNVKTPLLVPSFSSKALIDVGQVFEALKPSITESFLISAYDLEHKKIDLPIEPFAEVMFLDSGGYEVSQDHDPTDPLYPSAQPGGWTIEDYRRALRKVDPIMPTFVTAFDHPKERKPISQQIDEAMEVFKDFPCLGREILFKPEVTGQEFVPIQNLIAQVSRFTEFDIIGITETELGASILDRMANITRIRAAMDDASLLKPLHVFGSLDPVCTPLYFLAGADVFDGLSWIRFAYRDDMAVYHKNNIPLRFGITDRDGLSLARSYDGNLLYLSELKGRLTRYLLDRDECGRLGRHGGFFATCLDDLRGVVRGVDL